MTIRPETPADAAAIRAVTDAAFATAEHSSGTEAAIVERLRAAGALTLSLVAEEAGAVVGHVAFSPVEIGGEDRGWFGLGPVSVRPDRQRVGIGAALIEKGLRRLADSGTAGCVVLGDPNYYSRLGFARDPALCYPGAPPEYFLALRWTDPTLSGDVTYHPAFG